MICPSCARDNTPDAAFCNACGARLELVCQHCSRGNPTDARYCAGCGQALVLDPAGAAVSVRSYTPEHLAQKILRDRSSVEGERRTVSVLFSDAAGFTPLTEKVGEEQVYTLMQGCVSRMMDAVHEYEGTITSFTGDGVMAVFGAPIAHEDSARRAVAAGLAMQKALDDYAEEVKARYTIECQFRVGINTGPVVVGKISDDLDMDFTAIGDTVNLASRMEGLAAPGAVFLTENTHRLVADYFDCEALGELTVKGKSSPVMAYRALREKSGVRTRLQAAAERGLTPFVGRDQEMATLRGSFEQVKQGRGHVVFISGEAGIGKSRLLLEFRQTLLDEPVRWLEGHCISYGQKIPYLPIAEVVKSNFGVQEGDNDTVIIRRVDEGVTEWGEASRATVPYLKYLLNVDPGDHSVALMDPAERRAGILDGLRALLTEEARSRPMVIVIEDLHWVDEKSEDALKAMVDVVAGAPIVMVLDYRPGYRHGLGDRSYFSLIALAPLAPAESAVVAERVLQTARLTDQVRTLITSKGEGNPFYIEEVTKSLVESGVLRKTDDSYSFDRPVAEINIPETIQDVILARIDRLEREARDAIQLASVIGREFTVRLLNRISDVQAGLDDLLGELKTLELIYEKAYFPELSYMFKHALTHDVAYSTLLAERRKSLHRLVGRAIEELYADRQPEYYEALAYHFDEGEEWEKALEYLEKAGDKAAAAFANSDALHYYERALEVADERGESELARTVGICQRVGFVRLTMGDFIGAASDFSQMREKAQKMADRTTEAMALTFQGMSVLQAHDFEGAEIILQEALELAGEDLPEASFLANTTLLFLNAVLNQREEMAHWAAKADAQVSEVQDAFARISFELLSGFAPHWMGLYGQALEVNTASRPFAEECRVSLMMVWHIWQEGLIRSSRGEYSRTLRLLQELLRFSDRVGDTAGKARILNTIGWIHGELQDHETAIEWNQRSLEAAEEIKAYSKIEIQANARLNLADILMGIGRPEEAEEHFQWVERVVRSPQPPERWMLWRYAQHMFHSYGELWLARGDAPKAISYAEECLALAEKSESRKIIAKALRLRGQALLALDRAGESETDVTAALDHARAVGNPPQLWKTLVALGDLRKAQDRADDARAAYGEAMSVIEAVAGNLDDEALKTTFLESPHVQAIRAGAA